MISGFFHLVYGCIAVALVFVSGATKGSVALRGPVYVEGLSMAEGVNPIVAPRLLVMPLIFAILGFVMGGVAAWIFNFVCRFTKGIEIEVGRPARTAGKPKTPRTPIAQSSQPGAGPK